jgi:hypothetical protein
MKNRGGVIRGTEVTSAPVDVVVVRADTNQGLFIKDLRDEF